MKPLLAVAFLLFLPAAVLPQQSDHRMKMAQGKAYASSLVQREFETAWKNADTPLKLEDLYK